MNKKEWLDEALKVARSTHERSLNMTDMGAALDSLCEVAAAELLGGGEISLPGVGKLKVKEAAARTGRNPKTGETLTIPAHKKVVFTACKELKEAMKP